MTTLAVDPNVEADAVARLTDMYRDQPVILAIAEVCAARVAAYEAALLELYTAQWLEEAEGDLLDALGEIVGEPRLGRSDTLYKVWIRARILINRTQGKIADSYALARLIAGQDVVVHYTPTPPAAYRVDVEGTDVEASELYRVLDAVRPAGVRMHLFYSPEEDLTEVFTLSASGSLVTGDSDKGFGDSGNPAVGGKLRGIL